MKAFIFGADSVEPSYILGRKELFPTFYNMMKNGTSASYSAYVQKGFQGSYSSEQNWASLYTGLEPKRHGINTRYEGEKEVRPVMSDFEGKQPFWSVLNENGLTVGLWAADNCTSPIAINGYVVSSKYQVISSPVDERKSFRELDVCEKDKRLVYKIVSDDPGYKIYPKTLRQQGYNFEELKMDIDLAEEAVTRYHFQESIENFRCELEFWFESMKKMQKDNPVDVMFFYTPTTDLIAHCCMCCDDNPVLLDAYRLVDEYMGKCIEEFKPEISIFLSDHGQQNFNELIKSKDEAIKREAFSARDDVLWLKNGYIAFEAHNGALLFTAHALKGTFIVSGEGIKKNYIVSEMRTLDFYPTLLEMLNVEVPENRNGFVLDIFEKVVKNRTRLLLEDEVEYKSIALLQTGIVSVTDIVLNELFIEQRFSKITIVGDERYKEIFLNNPRVSFFVSYEKFSAMCYDEIYCVVANEITGDKRYIRIK